jgi:hypothetical protein
MAKRASKGDFNMAAEIRLLLTADPTMKGREVIAAIRKKHPRQKLNPNSAGVAFANARKALGISGPRKVKRRRRPMGTSVKRVAGRTHTVSAGSVNIEILRAAKQLLQECGGDAGVAAVALKNVAALQMT